MTNNTTNPQKKNDILFTSDTDKSYVYRDLSNNRSTCINLFTCAHLSWSQKKYIKNYFIKLQNRMASDSFLSCNKDFEKLNLYDGKPAQPGWQVMYGNEAITDPFEKKFMMVFIIFYSGWFLIPALLIAVAQKFYSHDSLNIYVLIYVSGIVILTIGCINLKKLSQFFKRII